jgi:hypothetical protein
MIMPTDQAHPVNGDHLARFVKKKRRPSNAPPASGKRSLGLNPDGP